MESEQKISIDQFKSVQMRVGHILSAEKVLDADKLLRLSVDFGLKPSALADGSPDHPAGPDGLGGERDIRQIISGIALYFPDPGTLVGRHCTFVSNLQPRVIRGLESNGMIMAVNTENGKFSLLEVAADIPPGTLVK